MSRIQGRVMQLGGVCDGRVHQCTGLRACEQLEQPVHRVRTYPHEDLVEAVVPAQAGHVARHADLAVLVGGLGAARRADLHGVRIGRKWIASEAD